MKNFLLLNKRPDKSPEDLDLLYSLGGFYLYADDAKNDIVSEDIVVLLKGYVVPSNQLSDVNSSLKSVELINHCYNIYGDNFIEYLKGVFTIIIIKERKISIFNDHFGLSKFFHFSYDNRFGFSNSLSYFKSHISFTYDYNSLIIRELLNAVPGKYTIFQNIFQSTPAQKIFVVGNNISFNAYWSPSSILNYDIVVDKEVHFEHLKNVLITNFQRFIDYVPSQNKAITITGGKDSRTGLAILKFLNHNPIGFTYGNPKSIDALFAKDLANEIGIEHNVFSPNDGETSYFENMAQEIVSYGNPNISIHRAHRLNAFKEFNNLHGTENSYFAGYMAGEFLMGVYYDYLIFSKYLVENWNSNISLNLDVVENKFKDYQGFDKNILRQRLQELDSFSDNLSIKEKEFYGLFEIGIPHHSQDIYLADNYFNSVYPFFIDVDFISSLFKTNFSFFHVNNKTKNLMSRYFLYEFNLKVQHELCPEMDFVKFGKKGEYNTHEYLKGKYYWSFLKTARFLTKRKKYPVNYKYNKFFIEFLKKTLMEISIDKSNELNHFFNINALIEELQNYDGGFSEKALKKYSNVAMIYLYKKQLNEI